jgi:hypothetical protein
MSPTVDAGADDLLRLWQDTILSRRDPEQLARRVARMKLARFDTTIARRNAREYVAVVGIVVWASWQMMSGGDRVSSGMAIAGALFVGGYLWWWHRQEPPLDATMTARDYQVALLHRIDHQIRLLKRVRYWYFLPISLPSLRIAALNWDSRPLSTLLFLAIVATLVILGVLLNELAVAFYLRKERAQLQSLYEAEEP